MTARTLLHFWEPLELRGRLADDGIAVSAPVLPLMSNELSDPVDVLAVWRTPSLNDLLIEARRLAPPVPAVPALSPRWNDEDLRIRHDRPLKGALSLSRSAAALDITRLETRFSVFHTFTLCPSVSIIHYFY